MNKNFVASYQKVATFLIDGNGKQGGNVASYFCTPDGHVLHVVAGPVNGATLLKEARWVVETWKLGELQGAKTFYQYQLLFRDAHLARLSQEHQVKPNPLQLPNYDAKESVALVDTTVFQRFNGPGLNTTQAKAHEILAAYPLPKIGRVYALVFEALLNEKISSNPVVVAK